MRVSLADYVTFRNEWSRAHGFMGGDCCSLPDDAPVTIEIQAGMVLGHGHDMATEFRSWQERRGMLATATEFKAFYDAPRMCVHTVLLLLGELPAAQLKEVQKAVKERLA